MNVRLIPIALACAVLSQAAFAADGSEFKLVVTAPAADDYVTASQLARETGLTPRQVRMVIGPHSGSAEYRLRFDRVQRQFRDALGPERYQDLIAGRPIPLYHQAEGQAPADKVPATLAATTAP